MLNYIMPKFFITAERWKYNKEYQIYVSTLGHFKNKQKVDMPIKINQQGYACVKTKAGLKTAHRLVLSTWRPIDNSNKLTVDHLDRNKRNNELNNLEWVTQQENVSRAKKANVVTDEIYSGRVLMWRKKDDSYNALAFDTVEDAYEYLYRATPEKATKPILKQVSKRITSATNTGGTYFGYHWERID
jgi:hypothetical protein